ncbi:PucR family transcriptional regulator [Streptomyces sp. NPDC020141]|uniref:PucR family transcriptional regulator n=1 Tax=Streptomyces sp. NPDC020141 TaxID=3365065 RepID=UPI0037961D11
MTAVPHRPPRPGGRAQGEPPLPGPAGVRHAAMSVPAPPDVLVRAAELVRGRLAPMVDRALLQVREEVPQYGDPLLAPADLWESAHVSLEKAVGSLASPERLAESGEHAWLLAARRAHQGMPLLALLQGYRIGSSVLWEHLVEAVLNEESGRSRAMAHAANDYWRYVGRDTALLTESHRRTAAELASGGERAMIPVLKTLLRGHSDPMDVSAAAIALDLPLIGRYAVVRSEGPGPAESESESGAVGSGPEGPGKEPAGEPVRQEADGFRLYRCPFRGGHAAVVPLGSRPVEDLARALTLPPGTRAGIGPAVEGLAQLGRARELAELALGMCGVDEGPALLDDHLSAGLMLARPDLAAQYAETVLSPVLGLPPGESASLLETLEVWLSCHGSTDRASERLFCHRNTVLNRLHRLEKLTGKRLDRPRDLVDLTLAVDARRLTGWGEEGPGSRPGARP